MRKTDLLMASMASAMSSVIGIAGEVRSRYTCRLLLTAIMLCLSAGMLSAERQPLAQEVPKKPNVLFILTDDQAPEDLAGMSNAQSLLVDQGTTFTNAFTTTPLCCPSRVSFMRGQYAHTHNVLTNQSEDQGGYNRFIELGLEDSTVATWLHDAGYTTFYAGKFLNGYEGSTYVPLGWDEWYAFSSGVRQQYTVNENGTLSTYTQDRQHETYYLRDKAETFIRNNSQSDAPWFAWISTHASHAPHTTAPEFLNSYDDVEMPTPPSYNEADVSDKPAWIQELPLLDDDCSTDEGNKQDCHQQVVEAWRARQEALMSVDVMVADLVSALEETNQLESTYIVLSSDNGFLLYRHRVHSKGSPYEESQGIPFVVRGPGVQRGVVSEELVANIDLAPTIAEWAGVQAPAYADGRSLVPLLEETAAAPWRQYLLFEFFRGLNNSNRVVRSYGGVRTAGGETYVEYSTTGEKEYYDLAVDPWQLESAHAAPENAERIDALSAVLLGLKSCAAATCREREDAR